MTFSNHAKKRMMERNKAAALMRPKEIISLAKDAPVKMKKTALCYILDSIDLVLVVNPENQVIITCYRYRSS
jgi:hypothetical protein